MTAQISHLAKALIVALMIASLGGPASVAAAQDATVSTQDEIFMPAELHVAPGTTVTWTNDGLEQHTVTADDATTFDSGPMESGATFSQAFTDPGRYPYYCLPHGAPGGIGMAGVIVVDG